MSTKRCAVIRMWSHAGSPTQANSQSSQPDRRHRRGVPDDQHVPAGSSRRGRARAGWRRRRGSAGSTEPATWSGSMPRSGAAPRRRRRVALEPVAVERAEGPFGERGDAAVGDEPGHLLGRRAPMGAGQRRARPPARRRRGRRRIGRRRPPRAARRAARTRAGPARRRRRPRPGPRARARRRRPGGGAATPPWPGGRTAPARRRASRSGGPRAARRPPGSTVVLVHPPAGRHRVDRPPPGEPGAPTRSASIRSAGAAPRSSRRSTTSPFCVATVAPSGHCRRRNGAERPAGTAGAGWIVDLPR